jgi:hypothetical protein
MSGRAAGLRPHHGRAAVMAAKVVDTPAALGQITTPVELR